MDVLLIRPPPKGPGLDSQDVVFWSESEGMYVCYFRTVKDVGGTLIRWCRGQPARISATGRSRWRCRSAVPRPRSFIPTRPARTSALHRPPHIYFGLAARFWPARRALSEAQAEAIGVHSRYAGDVPDAVLITSRGGERYDRTLGRYALRLDGFASVNAPYAGGEMITKQLRFSGMAREINYSTSAAGGIRVEIQSPDGASIPGFRIADCPEIIGDEIERVISWKGGSDVSTLAGQPVRLRFVMKDADLFALRFRE